MSHKLTSVLSNRTMAGMSPVRSIDAKHAQGEEDLLAEIGYKQELNRTFSTFQVFGIAYSIMGLLPSIASVTGTGLSSGPSGFVWSWIVASIFIFLVGVSMGELASAIPTSGGLYFWTYHYAPAKIKVPLSYMIGLSNSMALCCGMVSIAYGNAEEILAAVYLSKNGDFEITSARTYGVFAACIFSQAICTCISSKRIAWLQTTSTVCNTGLIVLFLIAVPIGTKINRKEFNGGEFIFSKVENFSDWPIGWQFCLSMMTAVWTIGAFDSCVHMSEEARNARYGVPLGIMGSIGACGILGWCLIICTVACMSTDVQSVLESDTGFPMAQIIYDSLGRRWAIAMMSLMAVCQWLMGSSIMTALSRQIWAFARDDGLPFANIVKVVDKRLKVPIRAVIFSSIVAYMIGCLCLAGSTASNALFSLGVAGNYLAWCMPVFLKLTSGRKLFTPGPFYTGDLFSPLIGWTTCAWGAFIIILCMFPSDKEVSKTTMNYTVVITCGTWLLSLFYYYVYKYKFYFGPKSNLSPEDVIEAALVVGKQDSM
ncbi:hypothetical protein OGAPHI_007465 [Ogataea philodendri]|uniref:GABA-specific permease n=1 Tax=Ogataea philodendri TaxID=1378263 RepID=A0A9P8SZV2_9ASCO|nr:uncharacterized protein OGAPHI_007465 [Ogataea philodendri]KAH3660260.1 hypothetical protein OGAPHI_007465 [Ogataea philodendri]